MKEGCFRKKMFSCDRPASGTVRFLPGQLSVNVNVGLPLIKLDGGPVMAMVPGPYVYFIDDCQADSFFYQGYWWYFHAGRRHRTDHHRGPWAMIKTVTPGLLHLPAGWRYLGAGDPRL
jgi:hypothetical protein